jgi:hypothetical protein
MAETEFTSGTILGPTFLNTIYQDSTTINGNTTWGIKHIGGNATYAPGNGPYADGIASQINLATDVTGLLPIANMVAQGTFTSLSGNASGTNLSNFNIRYFIFGPQVTLFFSCISDGNNTTAAMNITSASAVQPNAYYLSSANVFFPLTTTIPVSPGVIPLTVGLAYSSSTLTLNFATQSGLTSPLSDTWLSGVLVYEHA